MCFKRKKLWRLLGLEGETAQALVIDPVNSNIIYAGTYDPTSTNGNIYKSIDKGIHWQKIFNDKRIESIAINPVNTQILYASVHHGGIYKSTNGGGDWIQLTNGLSSSEAIKCVTIDPREAEIIYCGSENGKLFKSTDSGNIWLEKSNGLSSDAKFRFPNTIIVDHLNNQTLYAGTYVGVFKSVDAGENWAKLIYSNVIAMIMDPNNNNKLYFSTDNVGCNFASNDAGENWERLDFRIFDFEISIADSQIMYAAVNKPGGVFKSRNAGIVWESIGLDDYWIRTLALSEESNTLYAAVAYRNTDHKKGGVFCKTGI